MHEIPKTFFADPEDDLWMPPMAQIYLYGFKAEVLAWPVLGICLIHRVLDVIALYKEPPH